MPYRSSPHSPKKQLPHTLGNYLHNFEDDVFFVLIKIEFEISL